MSLRTSSSHLLLRSTVYHQHETPRNVELFQSIVTSSEEVRITLPKTNMFAPENGWLEYDRFLLGWPIFRDYVSFREGIFTYIWLKLMIKCRWIYQSHGTYGYMLEYIFWMLHSLNIWIYKRQIAFAEVSTTHWLEKTMRLSNDRSTLRIGKVPPLSMGPFIDHPLYCWCKKSISC